MSVYFTKKMLKVESGHDWHLYTRETRSGAVLTEALR